MSIGERECRGGWDICWGFRSDTTPVVGLSKLMADSVFMLEKEEEVKWMEKLFEDVKGWWEAAHYIDWLLDNVHTLPTRTPGFGER